MSSIMRKPVDSVNHSGEGRAADILEAMHAVMHLVRSRQLRGFDSEALGVTPMEGKVLGFFARQPGTTQSDLATHSGRDKGQLARLLNGLKKRGLLDTRPDEQDRRVIRLQLTPSALQLHDAVKQNRQRLAGEAVAALSTGEQKLLQDMLRRVLEALDKTA